MKAWVAKARKDAAFFINKEHSENHRQSLQMKIVTMTAMLQIPQLRTRLNQARPQLQR